MLSRTPFPSFNILHAWRPWVIATPLKTALYLSSLRSWDRIDERNAPDKTFIRTIRTFDLDNSSSLEQYALPYYPWRLLFIYFIKHLLFVMLQNWAYLCCWKKIWNRDCSRVLKLSRSTSHGEHSLLDRKRWFVGYWPYHMDLPITIRTETITERVATDVNLIVDKKKLWSDVLCLGRCPMSSSFLASDWSSTSDIRAPRCFRIE